MKNTKIYSQILLSLCVGGLLFLNSCTQVKDPKPLTFTKFLTGETKKSWLFTSIIVVDKGQASTPFPANQVIDACFADDLYTFYADDQKKLELSEGRSKCSPSDPDIYFTDSWSYVSSSAQLQFVFPVLTGQSLPYTIKSLTNNTLVVEYYFGDIDASYRITFTSRE